jgi:hypothetical protein
MVILNLCMMYYKSILSKTAGMALALFLAGCDGKEDLKTEDAAVALQSITVSPASVTLTMILDETEQLTAATVPADAPDVNISWISANEMVATVSASGLVTARRVGQTKVTAQSGRVRKDVLVTVNAPGTDVTDLTDFTFDPASLSVTFGDDPVKFEITKTPATAIAEFLFDSSNPNVATVATVGADNTITFVGVGSAEIIVIGRGNAGDVERRIPVTVKESIPGIFGPHTLSSSGLSIPMVNFDWGGEGVGYHDVDAANLTGTNYRGINGDLNCGVDIEDVIDNPNICFTVTGEWLNYTVNVQDAGTYRVSVSLSTGMSTGKFHLEADGINFTGTQDVPNNGSWNNWRWQVAGSVNLSAGTHVIRYVVDGNDCNLKEIKFEWRQPDEPGTERDDHFPITLDPDEAPRRMTVTQEDGWLHLETTAGDPYIYMSALTSDLEAPPGAIFIRMEYRAPQIINDAGFYFGKPTVTPGEQTETLTFAKADDWTAWELDISDWVEQFGWGAAGHRLRFDVGNDAGLTLDVRNMEIVVTNLGGINN